MAQNSSQFALKNTFCLSPNFCSTFLNSGYALPVLSLQLKRHPGNKKLYL